MPHMAKRQLADTPLARWLRAEIDERPNWGIRTLARQMNPDEPEIARRALNRYMYEGADPSDAYRDQIAAALGVDPSEVPTNVGPFLGAAA